MLDNTSLTTARRSDGGWSGGGWSGGGWSGGGWSGGGWSGGGWSGGGWSGGGWSGGGWSGGGWSGGGWSGGGWSDAGSCRPSQIVALNRWLSGGADPAGLDGSVVLDMTHTSSGVRPPAVMNADVTDQ